MVDQPAEQELQQFLQVFLRIRVDLVELDLNLITVMLERMFFYDHIVRLIKGIVGVDLSSQNGFFISRIRCVMRLLLRCISIFLIRTAAAW